MLTCKSYVDEKQRRLRPPVWLSRLHRRLQCLQ